MNTTTRSNQRQAKVNASLLILTLALLVSAVAMMLGGGAYTLIAVAAPFAIWLLRVWQH
jgi:hypothetical protein